MAAFDPNEETPLRRFLTDGAGWKRLLDEPVKSAEAAAAGLGNTMSMGLMEPAVGLVSQKGREYLERLRAENPIASELGGIASLATGALRTAQKPVPAPARVPSSKPLFERLAPKLSPEDALAARRSAQVEALIKQATTDPKSPIVRSERDPLWAAEQKAKVKAFDKKRDAEYKANPEEYVKSAKTEMRERERGALLDPSAEPPPGPLTKHERGDVSPTVARRDRESTRPILSDITATIKRLLGGGDD